MTRTSKKKLSNRVKVLITVVIIAICLFVLHKFDFFTKSENTNTTGIKFIEYGTENEVNLELDYFQDENNNSYIILPESINGYYATSYRITAENPIALFNNSPLEDTEKQENTESNSTDITESSNSNTISNTNNSNINNSNTTSNINTKLNSNIDNTITNTIKENSNTTNTTLENISNENTVTNIISNTNNSIEELENINTVENLNNTNTIENTVEEINQLTNTTINTANENSISTMSLDDENSISQNSNEIETNTIANNTNIDYMNTVENTVIENTNILANEETDILSENVIASNEVSSGNNNSYTSEANNSISNLSENDIMTVAIADAVYRPGEKIYLDAETVENRSATIEVIFDTKDVNGVTLYNREISVSREMIATDETEGESYIINLKGYIPKDYYLNAEKITTDNIANKIEGVKEFEEAKILLGLDITITDGTNAFNPKDYQQYVIATITSDTYLSENLTNSSAQVLHFDETENEEKIEKIVVTEKTSNSVKFVTDAFSEYAVIAYPAILPDSVTIDDYNSDYNYYIGKNYTDNLSGTFTTPTYSEANLAKVNINYFSYDYSKSFNGNNDLEIENLTWEYQSNQDVGDYINYTVRLTINAPTGKTIDPEKSWFMELTLPSSEFSETQTRSLNTDILSAVVVDSANNIVTITGNDLSGWNETTKGKTYTTDIVFSFLDNASVNLNTVSNLNITVNEKVLVGYVSADDEERQVLFSYIKCVPIDTSGNVTLELIDNPYMDRPAGYGFNGWITNENGYNITINSDTKLQKVTVNTSGQKEITINLYVNWAEANVIFVNGNTGNNNNDGKTLETAVRDWTGISNRFTAANRKTISNASNREVNIIVLTEGTLTGLTTNIQPGYTLTSLYDGVDYRYDGQNLNAILEFTGNYTLGYYDLQLDYLNVTGSNNYTSTATTGTINRYLIGNGRNVRIGRGMTPLTDTGAATTFAQVQGGPSDNTNINRSYRLVVESGKYANMHLVSTGSRTYTGSGTMVFGCDYDRIKNNNTNLRVYNRSASRAGAGTITTKDSGEPVHKIIIKSGSLGMDAFNNKAGDYEFSGVYIGGHSSGTDNNDRVMIVEGGNIANLLGGLAIQSSTSSVRTYIYMKGGHVQYIVGGAGVSTTRGQRTIQVTGGSVAYSVAGGSNGVTAGESSSSNPTGQLDGNTLVYVGGDAVIGTEIGNILYDVEAGCVLGAGNGNDILPDTAGKVNSSHVIIDGEATISNNVYGGGNFGIVGNSGAGLIDTEELIPESVEYINYSTNFSNTEHYMIGTGTSSGTFLAYNGSEFEGGSYNTGSLPTGADDWILEASNNGTYYLKSYSENKYVTLTPTYTRQTVTVRNGWGPWAETTTIENAIVSFNGFEISFSDMPQTQFNVQTSGNAIRIYYTHSYTIYTVGRNGYYTENNRNENNYISPNENSGFSTNTTNVYLLKFQEVENDGVENEVTEKTDATTVVDIDILGGTVNNNVYGGANENNILGSVDIYMENGTVEGAIYGGSNNSGTVDGAAKITVKGGVFGKQNSSTDVLFGGGRGSETRVTQRTLLDITDEKNNLNMYGSIYGGSALGRVSASSTVNVKDLTTNTNKILINGNIFGGGRGSSIASALTGGKVTVNVDGGTYSNTSVFGGCNERGMILNSILVNIGQNYATRVANVYGGGNNAAIIGSTNSDYVYLYKNATVEKAFNGGNNAGIQANNTITPRAIYAQGATVGELYGGSNNTGNLTQSFVYVSDGAIITNLYGGGYGEEAKITGRATVDIKNSTVEESVYGGGNAGSVGADTDVDIVGSVIGNIYAGGKGQTADVTTNTVADISNTTVNGNIYGGGNDGAVGGYTDINLTNTNVGDSVYAGGQGNDAVVTLYTFLEMADSYVANNVYGGGNAGQVVGNTLLTMANTQVGDCVYGGGKSASVATTEINIDTSNITNNIYGGGEDGQVTSHTNNISTAIAIDNSDAGNVFGGGKGAAATVAQSTSIDINDSTIKKSQNNQGNVYGGGDLGHVAGNATITVGSTNIEDSIYGGGNSADIDGCTSVAIMESNITGNVYGGGNAGEVAGTGNVGTNGAPASSTAVSLEGSTVGKSVFGGGNAGEVIGNTYVLITHLAKDDGSTLNTTITENVYGGGNQANVGGTTVNIINETTVTSVYGGGNLGEVGDSTSVIIDKSTILNNAFGGGSGSADDADGILGQIANDTLIEIRNGTNIQNNVFGGGDNGRVQGNSSVFISSSTIGESAYAAGNGAAASVLKNSYIATEGDTQIENNLFGGGNAAVTGTTGGHSLAIVDIAGAVIGGNVYGGANSSVINGSTATNIGIKAIDDYYIKLPDIVNSIEDANDPLKSAVLPTKPKDFTIGKISIGGTVFGGGENMDPTSDDFNYDAISVTKNILINVDGDGYETSDTDTNTIGISGSIFGSGNASSASKNGDINIRNYGKPLVPKRGISIQRATTVLIDNASLLLNGTTDSTSEFSTEYFTLNRIASLKIKNNTNLYLIYGANLLAKFDSLVGEDGQEEYATVDIIDTVTGSDGNTYEVRNGNIYDNNGNIEYYVKAGAIYKPAKNAGDEDEKIADVTDTQRAVSPASSNVNNRIYMYSGRNLNISNTERVTSEFGDVKGMTFFGIFKSSSGDNSEDGDTGSGDNGSSDNTSESSVYTGMYSQDYQVGNIVEWVERDFVRSYVLGLHQKTPEQDITKDGFYTIYEELNFELDDDEVLTEELHKGNATSYMSYIDPTPEDDVYYMWYAGPDEEVFTYTINLLATKHSTLGTEELSLHGISYENALLTLTSFDAALVEGVGLYDKNSIPNINTNQDEANNNYGLTMRTGNTGWSMVGSTDFYADAITENNNQANSRYDGTEEYTIENLKTTPLFNFYFYHSNNITEKRELGTCQINMKLSYWKDALNRGSAKVIIDVILSSDVTDQVGYNGAITPGSQYDLFTTSLTNVTTESSFSTYFELAQEDFMEIDTVKKYYENSYRTFTTEYAFPTGTTITMIDRWNKNNPTYYYYTVTEDDYDKSKIEYKLTEFKSMGSSNEPYNEIESRENYYISENNINYQYENFIFIVNFENADFSDIPEDQIAITTGQHFRMYLKADDPDTGRTEILFGLLDAQIDLMTYGIYDEESTIEVEADLDKNRVFLGNEILLDVDTIYNVKKGVQSVIIYDTRYFDKKLGIKITLYENVGDQDGDNIDDYEVVNGANLLGTYFELNNVKYYPRADGTTRIKIADLVSNASSTIKIGTENSSIATGEYQIKVETFGSADGIYYGIEASDSAVVNLEIINDLYGLNSILPENQVIIDKTTGLTVDSEGLLSKNSENKLEFNVEYLSGVNNPYITVSLYRRNYDETMANPYENTYTKVNFADYVNETLELPIEINQQYDAEDEEFVQSIKQFENEYTAIDTQTIKQAVSDNTISVTLNANYSLKEQLTSGTYKVVFTLYDASDEIVYKQEYDEDGNVSNIPFNVKEYMYIGETFSYIIIK